MKCKLTLPEKLKDLRTLSEYYHVSADYLLGITDTKKATDADLTALKLPLFDGAEKYAQTFRNHP